MELVGAAPSRRLVQPRFTDVPATCPYLEMDETWSSRLRGRRARSARRPPAGCGVIGIVGAGVVDGAYGAVGRVAWVGIGTLGVPIPTHIRRAATPVPRKTHSGHQRCRERAIVDTQRPERPIRDISHVSHVPAAPFVTKAGRCAPGPRSGRGEAGLPRAAGFACRAKQISTRTKVPNPATTNPGKTTRQPPDEKRTTTKGHR